MFCSECHEVDKNCDSLDAAKLTADGCEYTEEELKLLIEKWSSEQNEMKKQVRLLDVLHWQIKRCVNGSLCEACRDANTVSEMTETEHRSLDDSVCEPPTDSGSRPLTYIAGVDISFVKNDNINACAACVVVKLPDFDVVHEELSMVKMTLPYVPGFLAFREAGFLVEKIERLRREKPEIMPQAVLVDGNGILHPKMFGVACHIGVQLDLPSVGVAKTLYHVDGIENNEEHRQKVKDLLLKGGDVFPLTGQSGSCLGMALRSCDKAPNPVYVSPGHLVSMETAVWLVKLCSKYRIPEPIRQADIRSREYLRERFESAVNS